MRMLYHGQYRSGSNTFRPHLQGVLWENCTQPKPTFDVVNHVLITDMLALKETLSPGHRGLLYWFSPSHGEGSDEEPTNQKTRETGRMMEALLSLQLQRQTDHHSNHNPGPPPPPHTRAYV